MIFLEQLKLLQMLNYMLKTYFISVNCVYLISDDIIPSINVDIPIVVYNNQNINDSLDFYYALYKCGCQGFVVQTATPREMFEQIELSIRFTPSTKFNERRYLFIPLSEEKVYEDNIYESTMLEYVADFVIVTNGNDIFNFWTHKFIGADNYREPVFLGTWYASNETNDFITDLYVDKLTNQHGRVLRICTFDYKPYINIDSQLGIELMMTKEYAKHHNLSTKIINEPTFWGQFFDQNYTSTGAKKIMMTDQADISLGSWYRLPNYTDYFDLTESTVRIGVTFLVPAPKLAAGWFTLLFSFSTELWLGFIVSYFCLIISLFYYEVMHDRIYEHRNKTPATALKRSFVIVTVTLFIQHPLDFFLTSQGKYLRRIAITLIFTGLFYSATYTAGFSSVMTVPRFAPSIKNSLDLDASDIQWGAIHPALLDGFKQLPKYKNVVKNILIMTNEEIRNRMHNEDFAMLADRVPHGLVVADRIDASDVQNYRILDDDLYSDHCVLLVKRSSVLIPSIRKTFLTMKEAGLTYVWEMQAFFEENYKAQEALYSKAEDAVVAKLQWSHVQGAFGILWIGLAFAFVVFVYEKFHKQRKKQFTRRNTKKFYIT